MRCLIFMLFSMTMVWSQNIEKHQWKERIIIITGTSAEEELVNQQFSLFKNLRNALIDRKLVIYKCLETRCMYYDWKSKRTMNTIEKNTNKFQTILIDLDVGVKYTSDSIVAPKKIFSTIDSMPMRKAELKQKTN